MFNLSHRLIHRSATATAIATTTTALRPSLSLIGKRFFMDNGGSQWDSSSNNSPNNYSNYNNNANSSYSNNYSNREYRKKEVYRGTEEERASTTCLFVGALPRSWTEEDVRANFESFGPIENVFIHTPSKGFSFVKYENRSDAEAALAAQDGKEFDGRRIAIDWSVQRPRQEVY